MQDRNAGFQRGSAEFPHGMDSVGDGRSGRDCIVRMPFGLKDRCPFDPARATDGLPGETSFGGEAGAMGNCVHGGKKGRVSKAPPRKRARRPREEVGCRLHRLPMTFHPAISTANRHGAKIRPGNPSAEKLQGGPCRAMPPLPQPARDLGRYGISPPRRIASAPRRRWTPFPGGFWPVSLGIRVPFQVWREYLHERLPRSG